MIKLSSVLEYAVFIWDNFAQYMKDRLEQINSEAVNIITGASKLTNVNSLLRNTNLQTLRNRRENQKLILFHQIFNIGAQPYLLNLGPIYFGHTYRTLS